MDARAERCYSRLTVEPFRWLLLRRTTVRAAELFCSFQEHLQRLFSRHRVQIVPDCEFMRINYYTETLLRNSRLEFILLYWRIASRPRFISPTTPRKHVHWWILWGGRLADVNTFTRLPGIWNVHEKCAFMTERRWAGLNHCNKA